MPGLDVLEVTRRLSGTPDPPHIVIVTTLDLGRLFRIVPGPGRPTRSERDGLGEYVHAALHGGASGFLLKDAGPAMLVEAVRAAAVGDCLVPPAITVRLLRKTARTPRPPSTA